MRLNGRMLSQLHNCKAASVALIFGAGTVRVNGREMRAKDLQAIAGFVSQEDLLHEVGFRYAIAQCTYTALADALLHFFDFTSHK